MSDSEKKIPNGDSIENITVEELNLKTAKTSKGRKKSEKVGFFAAMKAEFKKIIWPNSQSLGRQTIAVVVCTIVLGLIIFGLDIVISSGFDSIFINK